MQRILIVLGLTACFVLSSFSVQAQSTGAGTPQITIEDARRIAAENGIASIREIELDDGKWEIEGADAAGRKHEMEIDARSGKVVKMERD